VRVRESFGCETVKTNFFYQRILQQHSIANNSKHQEMTYMDNVNRSFGEREDRVTSAIETQTAKIPSSGYLAAAIGSMGASALLKILGKDEWALFVGQWAPAFLIMGVYNKMVKQHGSDVYSKAA
jgi:hypothetical protein